MYGSRCVALFLLFLSLVGFPLAASVQARFGHPVSSWLSYILHVITLLHWKAGQGMLINSRVWKYEIAASSDTDLPSGWAAEIPASFLHTTSLNPCFSPGHRTLPKCVLSAPELEAGFQPKSPSRDSTIAEGR